MSSFVIIAVVFMICWTICYIVDSVMEQRRRETKTGEFEEDKGDEGNE